MHFPGQGRDCARFATSGLQNAEHWRIAGLRWLAQAARIEADEPSDDPSENRRRGDGGGGALR